jgi:hypothetical protein
MCEVERENDCMIMKYTNGRLDKSTVLVVTRYPSNE